MPDYRLIYRVTTALTQAEDVRIRYGEHDVHFLFSQRSGSTILAKVDLQAENYRAAQAFASGELIPPILDALSFASGTTALLRECELTLKAEKGKTARRGIYVGPRAIPRTVGLSTEAITHAESILAEHEGPTLPLCWFRYSHQRELTIEKFVFAWLSFEELAGDVDISSECPECKHVLKHRGANRERAWELYRTANPTVDRGEFNSEIWGRARNSIFHGSRYPDPEFLGFLTAKTPQLQRSADLELRRAFKINPHWQKVQPAEDQFRVFLFFEWNTAEPTAEYPTDWPVTELRALVEDADVDNRIRVGAFPFTLLNNSEFSEW